VKVFIIGLDCLEYKLVERWDLKDLKQKHYGRYDVTVAVKPHGPLYTPLIWTSFLTGNPSYKYGMDKLLLEREKVAWGKLFPLFKLRAKLPIKLGIRRLLMKLGLRKAKFSLEDAMKLEKMPEHARHDTFLEEAKRLGFKVWAEEIPAYNDKRIAQLRLNFAVHFFEKPVKVRLKGLKIVFDFVEKMWKEALHALENHDLVMFYSPLPDLAHHMFSTHRLIHRLRIYRVYKRLNDMVGNINISSNIVKIIVSDHGYNDKEHNHSNYGFWSINVDLPNYPRTVLDFKDLILKLLREE